MGQIPFWRWSVGGATSPTADEYAEANVTDVNADNLSDINTQLQILAHTDMADVQPMVTAINKILAYTDSTNPTPTNSDYALAGISGVNADNFDTLNGYVGGQDVAVADIPALVTQVDHLLVLRDYSADSTNTEPLLTNFTGAGVSTSRAVNLADYNAELVNQTLTTETQFKLLLMPSMRWMIMPMARQRQRRRSPPITPLDLMNLTRSMCK